MNICIINAGGTYRTGNLAKCLINNFYGVAFVSYSGHRGFISKIVTKVYKSITEILNVMLCDIVYIGIMSHGSKLLKLANILHKPVITEFYMSLYDTYVEDRKTVAQGSKKSRKLRKKDIYALQNSTKVILLSESDIKYYSDLLGVNFDNIDYSIIPLVVDDKPDARLNYFKGLKEYMQLCWTGSYIPLHGLERVIHAMKILKEKSLVPVKLYIWGSTDEAAKPYVELINSLELQDCITVHNEWGNLDKWERFVAEHCDLCVGTFGDGNKAKYVMPNKVIDGMAFKTPVITEPSTGVCSFCDGKDNIFISDNDPEKIAEKIIEISRMSMEEISERVKKSFVIYEENFSPKAFERKILKLISEVGEKYVKK